MRRGSLSLALQLRMFAALLLAQGPCAAGFHATVLRPVCGGQRNIRLANVAMEFDLDEMEGWWEDGLTCVEFERDGELRLGVYTKYSMLENDPHIRPLCASCEEDGISALLADEEVRTPSKVRCALWLWLTRSRAHTCPGTARTAHLREACARSGLCVRFRAAGRWWAGAGQPAW